jgi:hypothetical protein
MTMSDCAAKCAMYDTVLPAQSAMLLHQTLLKTQSLPIGVFRVKWARLRMPGRSVVVSLSGPVVINTVTLGLLAQWISVDHLALAACMADTPAAQLQK